MSRGGKVWEGWGEASAPDLASQEDKDVSKQGREGLGGVLLPALASVRVGGEITREGQHFAYPAGRVRARVFMGEVGMGGEGHHCSQCSPPALKYKTSFQSCYRPMPRAYLQHCSPLLRSLPNL